MSRLRHAAHMAHTHGAEGTQEQWSHPTYGSAKAIR